MANKEPCESVYDICFHLYVEQKQKYKMKFQAILSKKKKKKKL